MPLPMQIASGILLLVAGAFALILGLMWLSSYTKFNWTRPIGDKRSAALQEAFQIALSWYDISLPRGTKPDTGPDDTDVLKAIPVSYQAIATVMNQFFEFKHILLEVSERDVQMLIVERKFTPTQGQVLTFHGPQNSA